MYVYVVLLIENEEKIHGVFTRNSSARKLKEILKSKNPLLNFKVIPIVLDKFPKGEE